MSWPVVDMEQMIEDGLIKLGRGKVISKKDIAAAPGPYPIYSSAQLNDGKFGEYDHFMFDEELITWSVDGGGSFFHRPKHRFSVTNVGGTLKVLDRKRIQYKYLYYVLAYKHALLQFDWTSKAHPSVIRRLYTAIPLPPLAEQKRIAGILDAADALRAKRRESLAQLDTLLQSTFLDMFGDPVTNPMGWEVRSLKELLEEKSINGAYYPKDAYSDDGTPMVGMGAAFYGVVDLEKVKRVEAPAADIAKYGLRTTDLLISRRSLNYEGSAKPCLIPETDAAMIFESSLIRVRPALKSALTIYLFHYLWNDRARAHFVFPLVTRSTISGISQSNLMKVKVVLPPIELQHQFVAIVESIEKQKATQRAHLDELDILFASLQSRAFQGDL